MKSILEANGIVNDFDDACQIAGKDLGRFFLQLAEREIFTKTIKAALGPGKFNEEFFLDGIRDAIAEKYGEKR